jgi:hypothetical protein
MLPDGGGLAVYGFRLETDTHRYFLRCFADQEARFIVYAYDKAASALEAERPAAEKPSVLERLRGAEEAPVKFEYKMHSNPRVTGEENQSFIQAYERRDGEDGLIPGDVLFIGPAGQCRELLDELADGRLDPKRLREAFLSAPTGDGQEKPSIRERLRRDAVKPATGQKRTNSRGQEL